MSCDDEVSAFRPGFASVVVLTKTEVFAALEACASAERALLRRGHPAEAAEVAALFELLEDRVVLDPLPAAGGSPEMNQCAGSAGSPCPSRSVGSNSSDKEFTQ